MAGLGLGRHRCRALGVWLLVEDVGHPVVADMKRPVVARHQAPARQSALLLPPAPQPLLAEARGHGLPRHLRGKRKRRKHWRRRRCPTRVARSFAGD